MGSCGYGPNGPVSWRIRSRRSPVPKHQQIAVAGAGPASVSPVGLSPAPSIALALIPHFTVTAATRRCDACLYWSDNSGVPGTLYGTCAIVDGAILRSGTCPLFTPIGSAGQVNP